MIYKLSPSPMYNYFVSFYVSLFTWNTFLHCFLFAIDVPRKLHSKQDAMQHLIKRHPFIMWLTVVWTKEKSVNRIDNALFWVVNWTLN